jgi:hypothetical protein
VLSRTTVPTGTDVTFALLSLLIDTFTVGTVAAKAFVNVNAYALTTIAVRTTAMEMFENTNPFVFIILLLFLI